MPAKREQNDRIQNLIFVRAATELLFFNFNNGLLTR